MLFMTVGTKRFAAHNNDLRSNSSVIASQNSAATGSTTRAAPLAAHRTVAQFSAHAVMDQVTSAMAAQVHDLSGKEGMVPRSFGTQAPAMAIASGPGRAYRGRAWLANPDEGPSESVLRR